MLSEAELWCEWITVQQSTESQVWDAGKKNFPSNPKKKINTVDFGSTCVCEQNVFCDEDAPNLWGLIWIWQKPFKEKCDLKANERMSYKYTDKVQLHKSDFKKKAYSVTFKKVI